MANSADPIGWGGTLIFSYIRRLESFLGVQHFDFQYYFFGFQKKNIFGGYEDFVDIFGTLSQIWTILRGHFYAFWGLFKVQNGGYFFGLLKFQIFFLGVLEIPNIFWG